METRTLPALPPVKDSDFSVSASITEGPAWGGGTEYRVAFSLDRTPYVPDRVCTFGMIVSNRKTAERLVKAINDGKVAYNFTFTRNIHGEAGFWFKSHVFARYANADLKRLGY